MSKLSNTTPTSKRKKESDDMEELQEKDKLVYVYTSKPIEIMEKGWSYVRLDEEVASGFLDDIESIPKNLNPDKWQDTFLTIYNQVEGDEDSPAIMLPDSYRKNCVLKCKFGVTRQMLFD